MRLTYSPTSPFVRRVLAAAIELGLADRMTLEPVQVAPCRENQQYAEKINPLRKVPALVLDDGQTLVDSAVICQYLDELAGGGKLLPVRGPERWRVLSQQAIAQGMAEALVLVRYESTLRPEALRWQGWIDDQQDRFWSGLAYFEKHIPPAGASGSAGVDLSHLALACCLGYVDFRYAEFAWRARAPGLAAWYEIIALRPSLAKTDPRIAK